MTKRPAVDLSALTNEAAAPMPEAFQRAARATPTAAREPSVTLPAAGAAIKKPTSTKTENLQALAFKVPAAFRKRFRQCAANADLKLNELLFAALAAWEEKNKL